MTFVGVWSGAQNCCDSAEVEVTAVTAIEHFYKHVAVSFTDNQSLVTEERYKV